MSDSNFLNEISFQRNSIQLKYVELIELQFSNARDSREYMDLPFNLHRSAEIADDHVNIYLQANIGKPETSGFEMNIRYKGEVFSMIDMDMEELENYALQNVIPMLLPYIREVSSSIIGRTDLPNFMLPTLDVINYLQDQRKNDEQ